MPSTSPYRAETIATETVMDAGDKEESKCEVDGCYNSSVWDNVCNLHAQDKLIIHNDVDVPECPKKRKTLFAAKPLLKAIQCNCEHCSQRQARRGDADSFLIAVYHSKGTSLQSLRLFEFAAGEAKAFTDCMKPWIGTITNNNPNGALSPQHVVPNGFSKEFDLGSSDFSNRSSPSLSPATSPRSLSRAGDKTRVTKVNTNSKKGSHKLQPPRPPSRQRGQDRPKSATGNRPGSRQGNAKKGGGLSSQVTAGHTTPSKRAQSGVRRPAKTPKSVPKLNAVAPAPAAPRPHSSNANVAPTRRLSLDPPAASTFEKPRPTGVSQSHSFHNAPKNNSSSAANSNITMSSIGGLDYKASEDLPKPTNPEQTLDAAIENIDTNGKNWKAEAQAMENVRKNWKAEAQAMENVRAVAIFFPDIAARKIPEIVPLLVKQAGNLRSNIAKNAMLALRDLTTETRRALDKEMPKMLGPISKIAGSGKEFLMQAADEVLLTMVDHLSAYAILKAALACQENEKAAVVKVVHARTICHCLERMQPAFLDKADCLPHLYKTLGVFMYDREELRRHAKQCARVMGMLATQGKKKAKVKKDAEKYVDKRNRDRFDKALEEGFNMKPSSKTGSDSKTSQRPEDNKHGQMSPNGGVHRLPSPATSPSGFPASSAAPALFAASPSAGLGGAAAGLQNGHAGVAGMSVEAMLQASLDAGMDGNVDGESDDDPDYDFGLES
eukprot:g16405.t1